MANGKLSLWDQTAKLLRFLRLVDLGNSEVAIAVSVVNVDELIPEPEPFVTTFFTVIGSGTAPVVGTMAVPGLQLLGYSVRETAAVPDFASFVLRSGATDAGAPLSVVNLGALQSMQVWFGPDGLSCADGIFVDKTAGNTEIILYTKVKTQGAVDKSATPTLLVSGTADVIGMAAAPGLQLLGYSVRETAAVPDFASFVLRSGATDAGAPLSVVNLGALQSMQVWFGPDGLTAANGIFVDKTAGETEIVLYTKVQ